MLKEHEPRLHSSTGTATIGRPWRSLLLVLALALAFSMMIMAGEDAQAQKDKRKKARSFSEEDTVQQADFRREQANGAPINRTSDPFTFERTRKIASLNRIDLVLTLRPEENNFDADDLTLALDGINTGIQADETSTDGRNVKLRFNGVPDNADEILDELQEDGELQARLIDNGDNEVTISGNFDTTLEIRGKTRGRN